MSSSEQSDSQNIVIDNQGSPEKQIQVFQQTEQPSAIKKQITDSERRSSISSRSSEIDREMTEYNKELISPVKQKLEKPTEVS